MSNKALFEEENEFSTCWPMILICDLIGHVWAWQTTYSCSAWKTTPTLFEKRQKIPLLTFDLNSWPYYAFLGFKNNILVFSVKNYPRNWFACQIKHFLKNNEFSTRWPLTLIRDLISHFWARQTTYSCSAWKTTPEKVVCLLFLKNASWIHIFQKFNQSTIYSSQTRQIFPQITVLFDLVYHAIIVQSFSKLPKNFLNMSLSLWMVIITCYFTIWPLTGAIWKKGLIPGVKG